MNNPSPLAIIHPTRSRPRGGFTLIEVILSSVVVAIVMASALSAMMLTSRAINADKQNATTQSAAARSAADMLADDLKVAAQITEQTATAITMVVPDRDGDGQPETIRYAWSGVAGAPLTRTVNGGAAVTLANDVRAFTLGYTSRTVGPPPPTESAEELLVLHDAGTSKSIKSFAIKALNWNAEYIAPAFPPNTISWKISRIQIQMKRAGGGAGNISVQVRTANPDKTPSATVLATTTLAASTFPTGTVWIEFGFSTLSGLDPTRPLMVVVSTTSGASPASVYYDQASTDAESSYSTTANSGVLWTATTSSAMQIYVYGTHTTQSAN